MSIVPTRLLVAACCGCALACAERPPVPAVDVQQEDTLLAPGQALYWRGEHDSAQAVWSAALTRARADGDSASVANLLTWLGLSAMRTGSYADSRRLGEAALELKLREGTPRDLARSYNALGLLAMTEERLPESTRLFESAMAAARAADDQETQAAAAGNLGLVHAYLGDLEAAAAMLRDMRDAAFAISNVRLQGNALTNLAMVAIWSGHPQTALPYLDTARAYYRELDHPPGEQYALGQLATALSAMGEYQSALAVLDSALVLSRRHGLRDQEGENLRLLGGMFADAGDPRRALRHFEEAEAIARELGLDSELGLILRHSALVRSSFGSYERALEDARAALYAHRSAGEPFAELDDLFALAEIHQRVGDPRAARSALRSAGELVARLDTRGARRAFALARAQDFDFTGNSRDVLSATREAQALSVPSDFRAQITASTLAARAYARLGLLDSAAVAGAEALRSLERVRGSLGSDELRSSLLTASSDVYADMVLVLLQLGRTEQAFSVADAARSRELLQRLAMLRDAGVADFGEPELLLHRIDALLSQLRSMESTPPRERGSGTAATSDEIVARIARLRDEYESLAIRTSRADPRSAGLLGALHTDAARVRASLDPGEVMLHYMVTGERLICFVATRDTVVALDREAGADDIASRVRLLRELWTGVGADRMRGRAVAHALYDILIAPAKDAGLLDGATRLVIVPHGITGSLPFAALQDPASGRFLVEDFVLIQAPSAGAVPALRSGRPTQSRALTTYAFAPLPRALPGAADEARAASRHGRPGTYFANARAKESAVRHALAQDGIVHVAGHAVLNSRNPLFSRLELARGGARPDDDGRLEMHEVLRLHVRSALVVLSGCETGLSADWIDNALRASSVSALSQAFLQAGARNVMATLWRIDDRGSAELVRRFYEQLRPGDAAAALALAQREMIRTSDHSAPYYWAGFSLIGDGLIHGPAQ